MIPVIIPAYEPNDSMLIMLNDLAKLERVPIILVNDGSGDEYSHFYQEAVDKYGVILLKHERNRGKGAALKTAFKYCIEKIDGLTGCVTADSDGQHTANAIQSCIDALKQNRESLVLGVRNFDRADIPVKSQFGNNLTRKVFKQLYKKDITDTQTGLRGIPKDFMEKLLAVQGDRFEFETRMLIAAVDQNIHIYEVPIETIYDSKENHSTHFRPVIDSIRIYRVFGFAFGKFVFSSFSASVIDLSIFQVLCFILRGDESDLYVAIATMGARIVSAVYNYFINYFLVFKSTSRHKNSAVRYFLLAIAQMACSAVLVSEFCDMVNVSMELIVKIPVDVILFLVSFQIQKRYVYRKI